MPNAPYLNRYEQVPKITMTMIIQIVCFLMVLTAQGLSAQKISLGATYTNSSAYFLKNIPGFTIGYDHQIWKLNLFVHGYAGFKDYSYTESAPGNGIDSYYILTGYGDLFKGNANLGVAIMLLSTDYYGVSLGAFLGLNYLYRSENTTSLLFEPDHPGIVNNSTIDEWYLNRMGYGFLLDVEVKKLIIEQLSLFTRIEAGQTSLNDGPVIRGIPFLIYNYSSFTFSFGLKYNLKRKNASP